MCTLNSQVCGAQGLPDAIPRVKGFDGDLPLALPCSKDVSGDAQNSPNIHGTFSCT